MKIKITSDSTCDLGAELIKQNEIGIFSLSVILGENTYKDGEIEPDKIFDFVNTAGALPKTAAGTSEEYSDFFTRNLKGYDALIHFNISSQASSSHSAACVAAKDFGDRVYVVDSLALSTGQGLLVMKACDLIKEGLLADAVVERVNALRAKVNTSFVPDALDYLHKGGRCSLAALIGARVLRLHPMICEN